MEKISSKINSYLEKYEPVEIATGVLACVLVVQGAKYLICNFEDVKQTVIKTTFGVVKSIPGISEKIKEEQAKIKEKIMKDLNDHSPKQEKILVIPTNGIPHEEILQRMKQMRDAEVAVWKSGKISGGIYCADEKHYELQNQVYALFSVTNPLHVDLFPSIRKFETEIVKMTIAMLHGDGEVVGAVTSGGTESILMAVKAHKDFYSHIEHPEVILPVTAHAAFDKAGNYFGVKMVHIPMDKDGKVDIRAVRRAINKNTIMLVGSAPNFPHGIIDPISELAALAEEHGIGMHVDSCLGGFILPWVAKHANGKIPQFDFQVPGVTSISCDTHKYGYSTKGTSVVLFRNEKLRRHMYFVVTDWPGGVYASPTMSGSRPGGLIACCWASLVALGQDGFTKLSMGIYNSAQAFKEGLKSIPHIEPTFDSCSHVIAFQSRDLDIFKISEAMSRRGWHLNNLQRPSSCHLCFTANHIGKEQEILKDLRESVEEVVRNPAAFKDGAAALYGTAASLPDRSLIRDFAVAYVDATLST